GEITEAQWEDLMGTNLKTPLFLTQAAAPYLLKSKGCIINIVDIHGQRPLKDHPLYCAAKAGLIMLTQSLAREMGPDIRVNAVAPGSILWPNNKIEEQTKEGIINRTALKRQGSPRDIANAVRYLTLDADYVSGHILTVDGGRSLAM
ncbi:MAG: SDR family oxidoreductase, partial [Gammaproteobacteria bacterium]|nr:SDR family oxidoreductase [Gammaproteobacteria bacterium]